MKIFKDVCGKDIAVSRLNYIVVATDKVLSGWGRAESRIHKQIIVCRDFEQTRRVMTNLRRDGSFTYINWFGHGHIPYYRPSRYTMSYHHADDCPLWNK